MKVKVYQPNEVSIDTFLGKNQKEAYSKDEYHQVWEGDLPREGEDEKVFLEKIFEICNIAHPEGYTGHSLSCGDIVEIEEGLFICARLGWAKVQWEEK